MSLKETWTIVGIELPWWDVFKNLWLCEPGFKEKLNPYTPLRETTPLSLNDLEAKVLDYDGKKQKDKFKRSCSLDFRDWMYEHLCEEDLESGEQEYITDSGNELNVFVPAHAYGSGLSLSNNLIIGIKVGTRYTDYAGPYSVSEYAASLKTYCDALLEAMITLKKMDILNPNVYHIHDRVKGFFL